MKANRSSYIAIVLAGFFVLLSSCVPPLTYVSAKSEGRGDVVVGPPIPEDPRIIPDTEIVQTVEALITGNRYYLDPVLGNDGADGSSGAPWKTLSKAQSIAMPGDGVYLRTGNYGVFSDDTSGRNAYIVYRNEEGSAPSFTGIRIDCQGGDGRSYLAFFGISVKPEWVNPGGDPQDPNSTQSTYNKTANPVEIRYASNIMIVSSNISGQRKYLTELGILVMDSTHVRVVGCVISDVHRGTNYDSSQFIEYVGNHIHRIAGSAFKSSDGSSSDILIERNYAHDSNYDYADDYCPRALNANYHGSAIAIRCNRMVIRNNIFHDGFNSSGLMTYDYDGPGSETNYSDILIENNLLYDIRNTYALRFYLLGSNVIVRNNTIIGHWRSSGTQYYDTSINIDSVAAGEDGSGLTFDNNIVVGITNFGAYWGNVNQHNNVFYSCRAGGSGPFLSSLDIGGGSTVATSVPTVTSYLFESAFFNGIPRFDLDTSIPTNPVGHHQVMDFSLHPLSPAVGFGNPSLQPTDGLGDLDAQKYFILESSTQRSAIRHNAGAKP